MLLLVDLDGVVYRGPEPVPGVAEVLVRRAGLGDGIVYVTNNSMHYRADYVARLRSMGLPVTPDRVVSAPRATALYLVELDPPARRVLAVGALGLRRELHDVGLEVVAADEAASRAVHERLDGFVAARKPDTVVVGLDPDLTYQRIAVAADALRAGARFVATNRDPVYPTDRGLAPGAGSVVAAIQVAGGVEPIVIGKPEPLLLEEAARVGGASPSDVIMVGDGVVTDLPAARALGARSVLMLTGVSTRKEVEALPADQRPTAIAEDAKELEAAMEELAAC
jgi:HAD superfamily hydrolase (TIGR01450 family)